MIDKEEIRNLILTRRYTHSEIADMCQCSRATVQRFSRKEGIGTGQGVKNFWEFRQSSESLCFIIGAYLTDGYVSYHYKTKTPSTFGVAGIDLDFLDYVRDCLLDNGLKSSVSEVDVSRRLGNAPQRKVSAYSTMFATWLTDVCNKKSSIPDFIFDAPISHQVAFVSAAIDGDGSVSSDGTIKIRGIDHWLYDLVSLLGVMGIRTSGCQTETVLESGKPYFRVGIRREDFRALNPVCSIPRKQNRILYGVETRKRTPKRHKYRCGTCGKMNVSRLDAIQCISCYTSSEDLHDRLRKMNKDRHG